MKILGLDYGEKRIGLAVSDETLTLARELSILSPSEFWRAIDGIVEEQGIERIVVGLPLNMSGIDSEKTREVRQFAVKLGEKTGLPVELMDERLSSAMAGNLLAGSSSSGQKNLDSLAAQIILQNYLDKVKGGNNS